MLAIRQQTLGGPEVLELVDVPQPLPGPTEVLVRAAAAGVNPVDWKTRAGGGFLGDPPFTVGWDVAGVVEAVGSGVTRFVVGDRVFGMPRFPHEAAAYAEYVTSPSRQLAHTPEALDDIAAGAMPLAALAAWQALVETAGVQPGARVVVNGAAGGVGHLAVQIAKSCGAYVIGTARADNLAFLARIGVDQAVDYQRDSLEDIVQHVDVVLDLVGGDSSRRSLSVLGDGGLLITFPSWGDVERLRRAAAGRVRVTWITVEPDGCALEAIGALVDDGCLHVHVAETLPLAQAGRAHEIGEAGRLRGKLVLTVDAR